MWPFKDKTEATETGAQNAERFARMVIDHAKRERCISAYPHPAWSGAKHERYGWKWMMNQKWRIRVLELLQDAPIRQAEFIPPDDLDGWTFHAYSTVPVPRIAQLDLNETL